jgi:DNA-binding NarL/FixJ family response regulator
MKYALALVPRGVRRRLVVIVVRSGPRQARECDPPTTAPHGRGAGLTRRERDVALLVARGLSNRAIAAELVIAEKTVKNHVHHVLGKLGARSRAEAAARAAEFGLAA